jgi:uncharacterized protein YmfQ (DUF2313 family)
MLTDRATKMLATLPSYLADEPLIIRIVQAQANEVDRLDALIDKLKTELQPGAATDDLGLLGMWEAMLGLPVQPAGGTLAQRQAKVIGALHALSAGDAADVLAALSAAVGGEAFTVLRDTPGMLQDTLAIPYLQGSYNANVIEQIARQQWPAHRQLFVRYADGFLLELSRLDVDSF